MALKTYTQFLSEAENKSAMRAWIIDQVENTKKTHTQIKSEFLKKYPGQDKFFEQVVDSLV